MTALDIRSSGVSWRRLQNVLGDGLDRLLERSGIFLHESHQIDDVQIILLLLLLLNDLVAVCGATPQVELGKEKFAALKNDKF